MRIWRRFAGCPVGDRDCAANEQGLVEPDCYPAVEKVIEKAPTNDRGSAKNNQNT